MLSGCFCEKNDNNYELELFLCVQMFVEACLNNGSCLTIFQQTVPYVERNPVIENVLDFEAIHTYNKVLQKHFKRTVFKKLKQMNLQLEAQWLKHLSPRQ